MAARRLVLAVLCATAMLGACIHNGSDAPRSADNASPDRDYPAPVPTAGTSHAALPRPCPPEQLHPDDTPPVSSSLGERMYRIDWGGCPTPLGALRTTDAATAAPVAGMETLQFGYGVPRLSLSPDGTMLAAASDGHLHLYQVETWRETWAFDVPLGSVVGLTWAPGGRLYVSAEQRLWAVNPADGALMRLADLDFRTDRGPLIDPSGNALYLFGFSLADPRAFIVEGDPFIAVLDPTTGRERARVPLAGVAVGQRHEERQGEEFYAIYGPALALAPDGGRLFVVHAESERVTAIDLRTLMPAAPVEIARRPSSMGTLARFLSDHLVRAAEAKGGLDVHRQAQLSPDGRRLYISGQVIDQRPSARLEVRPQGLVVLDTRTMRVTHREEGVGQFVLSPDGAQLYAIGWQFDRDRVDDMGYMIPTGTGVKVFETGEMRMDAWVTPDVAYQSLALGRDGRYLHLLSRGPGASDAAMNQGRCARPCRLLTVLATAPPRIVAERQLYTYEVELVSPYP